MPFPGQGDSAIYCHWTKNILPPLCGTKKKQKKKQFAVLLTALLGSCINIKTWAQILYSRMRNHTLLFFSFLIFFALKIVLSYIRKWEMIFREPMLAGILHNVITFQMTDKYCHLIYLQIIWLTVIYGIFAVTGLYWYCKLFCEKKVTLTGFEWCDQCIITSKSYAENIIHQSKGFSANVCQHGALMCFDFVLIYSFTHVSMQANNFIIIE